MIRVAVVQFTPVHGDRAANMRAIMALIGPLEADIIVLPELCTSGYFFLSKEAIDPLAEHPGSEVSRTFMQASGSKQAMIIAGLPERSGEAYYNSVFVFQPGLHAPTVYRKSHLFYKEPFVFERGDTGFPVIRDERLDVSVGIMLCYDWRFPEASRALALDGADILACPSNLVTDAWMKVMPARAIENKVFVAVANRAGSETVTGETLEFKGRSALYDPWGEALLQAPADGNHVLLATIEQSLARDKRFNPFNDIFRDRRPDLYGRLCRR